MRAKRNNPAKNTIKIATASQKRGMCCSLAGSMRSLALPVPEKFTDLLRVITDNADSVLVYAESLCPIAYFVILVNVDPRSIGIATLRRIVGHRFRLQCRNARGDGLDGLSGGV